MIIIYYYYLINYYYYISLQSQKKKFYIIPLSLNLHKFYTILKKNFNLSELNSSNISNDLIIQKKHDRLYL